MTGFYRDGYCRVGPEDAGNHSVAGTYLSHSSSYSVLTNPSVLLTSICPVPDEANADAVV